MHPKYDETVNLLRAGQPALRVAADLGLSTKFVCECARQAGIALRAGRRPGESRPAERRPRSAPEKVERALDLMRKGASATEAARRTGTSPRIIRYWAGRAGFVLSRDEQTLVQMKLLRLCQAGLPTADIAQRLALPAAFVDDYRKRRRLYATGTP